MVHRWNRADKESRVKAGEKCWFRPGLSSTRSLDSPLTARNDNILQIDLPFAF